MLNMETTLLLAGVGAGLLLSTYVTNRYMAGKAAGCITFPLLFVLTLLYIFCASSIATGDIMIWFGWRLVGAAFIGLMSCIGVYRARQLAFHRQN